MSRGCLVSVRAFLLNDKIVQIFVWFLANLLGHFPPPPQFPRKRESMVGMAIWCVYCGSLMLFVALNGFEVAFRLIATYLFFACPKKEVGKKKGHPVDAGFRGRC